MQAENRQVSRSAVSIAVLWILAALTLAATGAAVAATMDSPDLAQAKRIRSEITARYAHAQGRRLAVTESSSTAVVESFTLLSGPMLEPRIVAADSGIYYAICPRGAKCPYPARRFAQPAAAFLPRRQALELAVRTFLETSATVVAVSLPTRRFVLFVVERDDLDLPSLAKTLSGSPALASAAGLRRTVDEVTRPRVFAGLALEPTPSGGVTWAGVALWPTATSRPDSFELVFDAHRSPASARQGFSFGFRNEGSFSADAPMCSTGNAVDVEHRLSKGWITELRTYTCGDGTGTITARTWLLEVDEASGYEAGIWKIVGGTGRYETFRGIGTYRSVVVDGDSSDAVDATSLEAWQGAAGFDATPPRVAIRSIRVIPPKASGSYAVRIAFTARDDPARSPVDFLVTAKDRYLLAAKAGRATSGTTTVKLAVRPTTGSRTIQLKLVASDAVGNQRTIVRTLQLAG